MAQMISISIRELKKLEKLYHICLSLENELRRNKKRIVSLQNENTLLNIKLQNRGN